MEYARLAGKQLAVVLVFTPKTGDEEWSTFSGPLIEREGVLFVDRGEHGPPFEIRDEWLPRIKPTPAAVSDIVNRAEYYLKLFGGPKPDDADPGEFVPTGLKLPD